jgi:hypothetical protein
MVVIGTIMSEGFISSIKKVMLGEDAGVSSDGVSTNSAGAGKIDGIGVGPKGELGVARRKRRIAKARNPKLFADIAKGGELDLMHYKEDAVELDRYANELDEAGNDTVVANPELKDPKDPDPKTKLPKKRILKRGKGEIELHPELPTRFEGVIDEGRRTAARPTQKCDFLVKTGLGDIKHLTWYRNALRNPSICVNSAQYRPVVADVLDRLLDLIFADPVLYNRLRMQLLQNREREQSESVDPNERFLRWKEKSGGSR